MLQSVLHRFFADFVELDAHRRVLGNVQQMRHVPGYGFALAVRVGREQHRLRFACRGDERLDDFLLVVHDDVMRLEILFYVDREAPLWQIDDVPFGREYLVTRAEILLDGFLFAYTFNNYQFHRNRSFIP